MDFKDHDVKATLDKQLHAREENTKTINLDKNQNSELPYAFAESYGKDFVQSEKLTPANNDLSFITESDMITASTEYDHDTAQGKRIVRAMKKNGYYKSPDSKTLYHVKKNDLKEIPYDDFHMIIPDFAMLGEKKPRKFDNKTNKCTPIEQENDLSRIRGYNRKFKFVAGKESAGLKNQITKQFVRKLPEIKSIQTPQLVSSSLRQVLLYQEGYDDSTGIFYRPDHFIKEKLALYKDGTESDFKNLAQKSIEKLLGRVPSFTEDSAQEDALLAYIVTTVLRQYLPAVPMLWCTTAYDDGQNSGKSYIGEQLGILSGFDYGIVKLDCNSRSEFAEQQFDRDFQKELADAKKRVIIIDNVIHKGDNSLKNVAYLASFLTNQSDEIGLKLTGTKKLVHVNSKRIVCLTGNNIYPIEGTDWNRRTIFLQLDYANKKLNNDFLKLGKQGLQKGDLEGIADIHAIVYSCWKAYLKSQSNNPFVSPKNTSSAYNSYNVFAQRIGGFIDWVYNGQSTFLADGRGRFKCTSDVKSASQIFIENWDRVYGTEKVRVSQLLENKEMKISAAAVLQKKEGELTETSVGRMLGKLVADDELVKKEESKANFYHRPLDGRPKPKEDFSSKQESVETTNLAATEYHKKEFSEQELERIKKNNSIKNIAIGKKQGDFVCCPAHNDINPSAHITKKHYGDVWYCHSCQARGDVIKFIEYLYNIDFVEACHLLGAEVKKGNAQKNAEMLQVRTDKHKKLEEEKSKEQAEKISKVNDYLQKSIASNIPVNTYLKARTRANILNQEGFYNENEKAAVVPLRNSQGQITAIQRYYLNNDHTDCLKTDGKRKKLSLGYVTGSCVCIYRGNKEIGYITEGLETGYGFLQLIKGRPDKFKDGSIYVAISCSNISNLDWLPEKEIIVACDNQKVSREAFERLKVRMGNQTQVSYIDPATFGYGSSEDKQDFLDMYLASCT